MFHVKQSLNLNFNTFPTLYTDRLILRNITLKDAEDFFTIRSNPDLMYALDKLPYTNIEEINSYVQQYQERLCKQEELKWAICLKENNKMIGAVGFFRINDESKIAEIGYELLPAFHRQGIAFEAISEALNYAFNLIGFADIEAGVNPDNYISIRLLFKCGFIKVRHVKGDYYYNSTYLDSDYYSLSKNNYIRILMQ